MMGRVKNLEKEVEDLRYRLNCQKDTTYQLYDLFDALMDYLEVKEVTIAEHKKIVKRSNNK